MATPTFFGYVSYPNDNVAYPTSNGPSLQEPTTVTITPPASMAEGDLAIIYAYEENGSSGTITMPAAGGQSWTTDTTNGSYEYAGTAAFHKIYWCRFDGTWSTLQVAFAGVSGTRAAGLQMLVFRPDSTTKLWYIDQSSSWVGYSAPSTPFTVSITGPVTTRTDTVSIARWFSDDNNSWDTLTGTGWTIIGGSVPYFRNQGGSDVSAAYAHNLQASATDTGTTTLNQASFGGDPGAIHTITFYATGGAPQTLTQSASYSDDDTFYSPVSTNFTIYQATSYTEGDSLYTAKVNFTLYQDTSYSDETDTFYTPSVHFRLNQAATFTDGDTFYSPDKVNFTLYQDTSYSDATDTFYTSQLNFTIYQDSIYSDGDTFYSPDKVNFTLSQGTSYSDETDTFYTSSVTLNQTTKRIIIT